MSTCRHDIDYDIDPELVAPDGQMILRSTCIHCGEYVYQNGNDDWVNEAEYTEMYHWPKPVSSAYSKSYLQWLHADDSTHDRALTKFGLALQTISIGVGGLVTPEETAYLLASKPFENHRTTRQSDRENKQ